jgi:drug/metabolite transporter (DMT)-like permease
LVLLGALWGAVYPLTTVVLRELTPPVVVAGRAGIAAVVLVPVAWRTGALAGVQARAGRVLVAAVLQATLPLVLLTLGQQHVGAGVAGIVLASQAVWAAVMAGVVERVLARRVLAGVVIGLVGVALLFVRDLDVGATSGRGGVLLLGAAISFAAGTLYLERMLPDVPALTTATAAMVVSAVALAPFAVAAAPSLPSIVTLWWLVVLAHSGSGAALVLFYWLIGRIGAVRANVVGYLAPGFAVAYGLVLLQEPLTLVAVLGLVLILAGSIMASRHPIDRPGDSDSVPAGSAMGSREL